MQPRLVQCPECGNRYDAVLGGFCPRCGAVAPAPGAPGSAPAVPSRATLRGDPVRRRVQVGGMLLATWGALMAIACLGFAALPQGTLVGTLDQVIDNFGDSGLPGGALHVQVLDNGTAVRNATVELRTPAGQMLETRATGAGGWANTTLGEHWAVNLTVRADGHALERRAVVRANDTLELHLDVARGPPAAARLGTDRLASLVRVTAGVLGGAAVLLLAGGIAALVVRWPALAIAGPIPVLGFVLLLAVASLSVGVLVVLLLQGIGLALVVSGRSAFRR